MNMVLEEEEGVQVQVEAPDLLEPSARMLVDGPGSLHRVDNSITAARSGG